MQIGLHKDAISRKPFAMKTILITVLALSAVLVLTGCMGNPYVDGFTGQPGLALPEDAPVAVIGANRADPLQMRDFDQALAAARANQRVLGSSTIISASPLRDAEAADAGRTLGASLVLYSFEYLDSTVERDTQSYRRYNKSDDTYYYERRSFDSTRHWYEYRAYFFKHQQAEPDATRANDAAG